MRIEPRLILDTSVWSRITRPASAIDFEYLGLCDAAELLILPLQVVEEAIYGARKAGWGARRLADLERDLARFSWHFPTPATAHISAELRAHAHNLGRQLGPGDAWIAASAIELGLPLVHHDRDYEGLDFQRLATMSMVKL